MKKLLLLFAALFLVVGLTHSQETITIGTQVVESSASDYGPTNYAQESRRLQWVITAAEILAAGGSASEISAIAYDVSQVATGDLVNYTVRMAHTTATDASSHNAATLTTVVLPHTFVPGSTGWRTLTFDTNFDWNGTDNILFDVCWGVNSGSANNGRVWLYNNVADQMRGRAFSAQSACESNTLASRSGKPRMQLTMQTDPCTGTPNPGNTLSSDNPACEGVDFNLSLENPTLGTGVTFQWQSAADINGPWTNIGPNAPVFTTSQTETTYYRCQVTCTHSSQTGISVPVEVGSIECSFINMPTSGTVIETTCNALFYDSGGPTSNYSNNENGIITFLPAVPNNFIQVNFISFHTETTWDPLRIYDGSDIDAPLLGIFSGSGNPGEFIATNAEGALTFRFTSDGSVNFSGWEAEISCFAPPSARAQFIHNSALAGPVDIFVDSELVQAGVDFREATPFLDIAAGEAIEVYILPAGEEITKRVFPKTVEFSDEGTYIVVIAGDESVKGTLDLFIFDQGQEAASDPAKTDLLAFHGSTDAPMVSIWETAIVNAELITDLSFGDFDGYLELDTEDYILEVRADGTAIAAYFAPLADLNLQGEALVVLASGFINPPDLIRNNGTDFGLFIALPSGGPLVPLGNAPFGPEIPLSNWALYLGILLMGVFAFVRIRKMM